MEIWIIRDGEKTGPFHDFEVRRRIEDGELTADNVAWHEGMDGWKPLSEIELFRREFEKETAPTASDHIQPEEASPSPLTGPPPIPQQPLYGRRFWARWFDLAVYGGIWWFCLWAARQNVEAAWLNPWIMFFKFVPWFVLEALLIHYTGTTPGKWLLGMHVVNQDGSKLDLAASTRRSVRVMLTGVGFGWPLLALFCHTLSYFTAKRLGTALWDYTGGHRVNAVPLNPLRLIPFVLVFFAALQLHALVLYPYMEKVALQQNPELKETLEKRPKWYLPKRHSDSN
ncbi:MAG: RDD family protein [Verrucomicrobiaceae bacterium]|nr:MAG: RDD family protein [Verrucomicrobiaceae bacterium]